MILNEADAKALSDKILAFSKSDSCIVTIGGSEERHIRFAQNMATTNGSPSGIEVRVESHFGKQSGSASGTELTDDALAELVKASENTAKLAPENPEFMPPIGPQKYTTGSGFSSNTQLATSEMLAGALQPVLQQAQAKNLQASGFLNLATSFSEFCEQQGPFLFTIRAPMSFTRFPHGTPDGTGSGWAGTTHFDFSKLDAPGMGAVAIDKAVRSQKSSAVGSRQL